VSQAARGFAVNSGNIDFRIAVLTERAGDVAPFGRDGRPAIRAGKLDDAITRAAGQIDKVDISEAALVAGVSQFPRVRGQGWADTDRAIVGKLDDIRAVVVGGVDLLVPGTIRDKRNL